jgi:acyl carrier protein
MSKKVELEDIYSFIVQNRWEYEFELTKDTLLCEDLKIWGDDAVDILLAFGKKFDVDLTKFYADKYFPPESLFGGNQSDYKPITIGDLLNGARDGKLE